MLSGRIRELRLAGHITQTELAAALGVTKQSVSNWENDNIQPSIDMLLRLADFFSVSTDYLLGLENEERVRVDGLNKEQRAHIQAVINDILDRENIRKK